MAGRLAGKRALLTAAGAGIGRATALLFAREGAHVIATDIDLSKLRDLPDQGIAEIYGLDVRSTVAVAAVAESVGPVDILFNCAGFVHHGTILECSEQDWDFCFDLNVKSMHRTIRAFLPGMLEQGHGTIVNVASAASTVRGIPNRYAYGTTKAAVIGLTKSVAADFVTKGIRCNSVCPGTVDSPSLQQRLKDTGDYEAARKAFTARQPMGRIGTAEEIASIVLWLASDDSQYATGQNFILDGGITI
jgi:2-keto-3-deoxy-L-fuconate dehydrogenase